MHDENAGRQMEVTIIVQVVFAVRFTRHNFNVPRRRFRQY